MTAIMLTRNHASKNMYCFYSLDVQPDLFGGFSLIREWGRIGRAGQVRMENFPTRGAADLAMVGHFGRKARKGYH
ncbi:WGR domain-containing protein [Bradyrhizobium elkanii]|uniref:WGR domain-containing protein n=1 Tax=Bradyrhizobium elkanii TaxID=29448 RepID=A0A4U6RZ80_BRAEL|nr:WGR domain-containing protein [Bradyrhizobium elkanii]TKV80090.1 WGR domain-containing protein [Bradyrhizobium elkanii]